MNFHEDASAPRAGAGVRYLVMRKELIRYGEATGRLVDWGVIRDFPAFALDAAKSIGHGSGYARNQGRGLKVG
jgi:hypothetical protein